MNWAPPQWVREEQHHIMDTDVMSNHYSQTRGRPRLLKAISKHYSKSFGNLVKEGRELAMDEIVVTAGANGGEYGSASEASTSPQRGREAPPTPLPFPVSIENSSRLGTSEDGSRKCLPVPQRLRSNGLCRCLAHSLTLARVGTFAALVAHIQPGDEVIIIEPYFDQYFASIVFQGGKPVMVPLHPPTGSGQKTGADWRLDMDEFRAAFTEKTKCVMINTPHNPTGKVYTRAELEEIAKICVERKVLVLADEVYDCLLYDDTEHVRIAEMPGMWERTLTIGSGGSESEARSEAQGRARPLGRSMC